MKKTLSFIMLLACSTVGLQALPAHLVDKEIAQLEAELKDVKAELNEQEELLARAKKQEESPTKSKHLISKEKTEKAISWCQEKVERLKKIIHYKEGTVTKVKNKIIAKASAIIKKVKERSQK